MQYAEWDSTNWEDFKMHLRAAEGHYDARPLFNMYETRFIQYMTKVFDTQGAATGRAWKPLSSYYIMWKGHSTIGYLTGAMRSSLTGGAGYVSRITKTEAFFGQSAGAAPYTEHFDSERPIAFSTQEKRLWRQMAEDYYAAFLEQALDPTPKAQSFRLPDGQIYSIDKNMNVRIKSSAGLFQSKGTEMAAMKKWKSVISDTVGDRSR